MIGLPTILILYTVFIQVCQLIILNIPPRTPASRIIIIGHNENNQVAFSTPLDHT